MSDRIAEKWWENACNYHIEMATTRQYNQPYTVKYLTESHPTLIEPHPNLTPLFFLPHADFPNSCS